MSPSGIDDFPNVGPADIAAALPFLKRAGVPFYVHAEQVADVPASEVQGEGGGGGGLRRYGCGE